MVVAKVNRTLLVIGRGVVIVVFVAVVVYLPHFWKSPIRSQKQLVPQRLQRHVEL